jgi:hypothetical protein
VVSAATPTNPQTAYRRWIEYQWTLFNQAAENGLAHGAVEFHIMRPIPDPSALGSGSSGVMTSRGYVWFHTPLRHPRALSPTVNREFVELGVEEVFEAELLSDAYATLNMMTGLYDVFVEFPSSSDAALKSLHDPRFGDPSLDWFGEDNQPLHVYLVVNGKAHGRLAITEIIANDHWNQPLQVARDLPQIEADRIVAALAP